MRRERMKRRAGSDITFFEYPGALPGRAGDGMVHRVVFRVASEASLDFWTQRVGGERSEGSLLFADPEGLALELIVDDSTDEPLTARHPHIPAEHAIRGFAGVRAYASAPERSAAFLNHLGFDAIDGGYDVAGDSRHGFYLYDPPPAAPGSAPTPQPSPQRILARLPARSRLDAPARGGSFSPKRGHLCNES